MKNLILILLLFHSSLAFSGNYSEFYRNCILTKKGKFNYRIEQIDQTLESLYTPSGIFESTAQDTVMGLIRSGTRVYDEGRNIFSVLFNERFIEGKNIRSWTISTLKEEIRRHRLNSFEKASLINCAVFSLIGYRRNMDTKLGSIYAIYEKGEGICTEMTSIALDLAKSINLKVRSVSSDESHIWPEYYINGTWYILDPTSNSYVFMESLKN